MTAPWLAICAAWLAVVGVWIAKARGVKLTDHAQSSREQGIQLAALIATMLVATLGPGTRLYTAGAPFEWTGALLAVAGCSFAIWARLRLGTNWSPHAVIKTDHDLLQTGPYAWTRHPIYTGLLAALLGSAIAQGRLRGYLALAVLGISFHYKAKAEEVLLSGRFGLQYEEYQRRVCRLVPLIW